MSTKADKGRDLPAVEPQQTPVAVQQPQVTDQQPTSTATYEGEFAVSKGAGYPSATQISGQGTVNTAKDSGQGQEGATADQNVFNTAIQSANSQTGRSNKIERDQYGNYYVNGVKTPMTVFNPGAVPYKKDEQQTSGQETVNTTQNSGQGEAGATNTTGQQQTVTTPQVEYKYPWETGMTMDQAYEQGKHSWHDIYMDRYRWGVANNNPVNVFEAANMAHKNHDVYKTKTQNEEDIKKAERKEKFDKLGNFFMHLGNFVGAVGFGGLDVKPEDPIKFTERQQRLKDKTEALRDATNKEWFQNATKQQAADRQAELDKANAEHKATQDELARRKQEDLERRTAILEFNAQVNKEFKDAKTRNDERITEIKVALAQGQINLNQARAALTNIKASVEAGGKTVEKRDAYGSVTVTTTTPNTNGKRTLPNRVKKRLPNK